MKFKAPKPPPEGQKRSPPSIAPIAAVVVGGAVLAFLGNPSFWGPLTEAGIGPWARPPPEKLAKWLVENGAWLSPNLTFTRDHFRGFGVFAARSMNGEAPKLGVVVGELLMRIPHGIFLDYSNCMNATVMRHPELAMWLFTVGQKDQNAVVIVALMHQKLLGEDSFFAPWLGVLPDDPIGLVAWKEEDAVATSDGAVLDAWRERRLEYLSAYDRLAASGPPRGSDGKPWAMRYSFDLYTWARSIFESRAVDAYGLAGHSNAWALVPGFDLLNHGERACPGGEKGPSRWEAVLGSGARYRTETDAFEVPAAAPAAPGEEVQICYRPQAPNTVLLAKYGFALEANPNGCVEVAPAGVPEASMPGAVQHGAVCVPARRLREDAKELGSLVRQLCSGGAGAGVGGKAVVSAPCAAQAREAVERRLSDLDPPKIQASWAGGGFSSKGGLGWTSWNAAPSPHRVAVLLHRKEQERVLTDFLEDFSTVTLGATPTGDQPGGRPTLPRSPTTSPRPAAGTAPEPPRPPPHTPPPPPRRTIGGEI